MTFDMPRDEPAEKYDYEKWEASIDFTCRVCGVQCAIAPHPPERAVCHEHCEDHKYEYDPYRRGSFCVDCDQQCPDDWFDDYE